MDLGTNKGSHEKQKDTGVTKDHLMQEAAKLMELEDSYLEKQKQVDNITTQKERTKAGNSEREMNEKI